MWDIIFQQYIYRLTNDTASLPSGCDGSVGHLDLNGAPYRLRHSSTVKFIWSGEIHQMNARLTWKYAGYYMSTKHIQKDI